MAKVKQVDPEPKHQPTKAYRGMELKENAINFDNRWSWVVSFTFRPPLPRERTSGILPTGGWLVTVSKHHTMKIYKENGDKTLRILNLAIRCSWMVNFTLRSPQHRSFLGTHWIGQTARLGIVMALNANKFYSAKYSSCSDKKKKRLPPSLPPWLLSSIFPTVLWISSRKYICISGLAHISNTEIGRAG
jgi:hypothetical protein